MTISRLDAAGIGALVGPTAAKHLRYKNIGGESNLKGGRYEQLFGAYQLAKLSKRLVEDGHDTFLEWQGEGFVDDYLLRRDYMRHVHGFQLKNSGRVSWAAPPKQPIAQDFALQHAVCAQEGYTDIALHLVCAKKRTVEKLKKKTPASIQKFASAEYFPYAPQLMRLMLEHPWLKDDFAYMSNRRQPGLVEAQIVMSVLMGAWGMKGPVAWVSEVLDYARTTSPSMLRAARPDGEAEARVKPELRAALGQLSDFEYHIARGFFQWSAAGGSTSGVLPFDCFGAKFDNWQDQIVSLKPKTFEDIERALQ